jgi:hypothetical protein
MLVHHRVPVNHRKKVKYPKYFHYFHHVFFTKPVKKFLPVSGWQANRPLEAPHMQPVNNPAEWPFTRSL